MDKWIQEKIPFLKRKGPLLITAIVLLLLPAVLSDFRLNLIGKFLTFAIVAHRPRPALGVHGGPEPRARRILQPGGILHGHVPETPG